MRSPTQCPAKPNLGQIWPGRRRLLPQFAIVLVLAFTACSESLPYYAEGEVVRAYPHDAEAFTQGLVFDGQELYESTGLYGESSIRRVDLETGDVLQVRRLPDHLFGEGCTVWGDTIVQLTWKAGLGYVYDKASLEVQQRFGYQGEGWGLTDDGSRLIMSDGTSYLRFLDPETLQELDRVQVVDDGRPVVRLNELEWVRGEVWANVWQTAKIVRIDPESGEVLGWIDFSDLVAEEPRGVLNGIALRGRELFVTGKRWNSVYQVRIRGLLTSLQRCHRYAARPRARLGLWPLGPYAARALGVGVMALCLAVSGCTVKLETSAPSAAATEPSVDPTTTGDPPTATPTLEPTAAPLRTPAPTLNPTVVVDTIERGRESISARDIDPLCLQWMDADDDGAREWVGLYLEPGDPARLLGFVLDNGDWHALQPPAGESATMGRFPTCTLRIEDVNADGRTEILVEGHEQENVDLLHIFVWEDGRYGLLASFGGDAGIDISDIDGDMTAEIITRWDAGSDMTWEAVHTWDGSHYAWTWERYGWLYPDHPHLYVTDQPRDVLISFYLALSGRDLPGAYDLMSSEARGEQSYSEWAAGFDTTLEVEVGSVRELERVEDRARVTALVRAYDNAEGYVIGRLWDVTWTVVREAGGWRLLDSQGDELQQWEAEYYD